MSAVEAIRKDLKRAAVEPGTVIKFTSMDVLADKTYTYAALFIAGGWWLTGTANHFGRSALKHSDMIGLLGGEDILDVQVATVWEHVK